MNDMNSNLILKNVLNAPEAHCPLFQLRAKKCLESLG